MFDSLSNLQPNRLAKTTSPSASLFNKYAQVNTERQSRQEARERRRRGDWDILEIPTALLWLDVCEATTFDPYQALECDAAAAIADFWP